MHLGATLYVHGSADAVRLYQAAFGLELGYHEFGPDGSYLHAELCKDGKEVFAVGESGDLSIARAMLSARLPTMSYGINFADEAEIRRAYDALAEGGHVLRPLGPLHWSPMAADLVDRYGVYWYLYLPTPGAGV